MTAGYYREPTVHGDRVVYVCEDDLWEVPLEGGASRRLTSGRGQSSSPFFSPDGKLLAFTATEEGATEIRVMESRGGQSRQLTYLGARCDVVGWTPDGAYILFWTTHQQAFSRDAVIFQVPVEGGEPQPYRVGRGRAITHEPGGEGIAIARNASDISWWKRYRGGTAANIWISRDGNQWTRLFTDKKAGVTRPLWLGDELFFLSDFEGYANLYRSTLDGEDIERVTHHEGFYVRHPQTDGETIVYSQGADLWALEPNAEPRQIEIEHASPQTQMQRRFVDAEQYAYSYGLHPDGHSMALTTRGKLFNFGLWEGGVRQNGVEQGVRYDHPVYLDEERILIVSDEGGEPHFEIHQTDGTSYARFDLGDFDAGRPVDVKLAPDGDSFAFVNNKNDLVLVELETKKAKVVTTSELPLNGFDWAPDSRYIAYGISESHQTSIIRVYAIETGETHDVTSGDFKDVDPVFDPGGRYLYFLSYRFFEPVYDQLFFEISFPKSMKPCVVTLREDVDSPFFEKPRSLEGDSDDDDDSDESESEDEKSEDENAKDSDSKPDDEDKVEPIDIDFERIHERVEAFPTATGLYGSISATEDRVFWSQYPVMPNVHWNEDDSPSGKVRYYNLKEYETKTFATGVHEFHLGPDQKTMALWGDDLRIVSASASSVDDSDDDKPGRKSGIVDLERIQVEVDRRAEWRQMLHEAWRLMRDHYWNAEMAGVDWKAVYERYQSQVERVASRSEFSDLVWRMQGEMGTSHAYEIGGDYRRPPQYRPGFLGADVTWNEDHQGYRIDHIVRGDTWDRKKSPPLARPGLDVREGDVIKTINGRPVDEQTSVQQRLVSLGNQEVELVLLRKGERHTVTVKTTRNEMGLRYRAWVATNRRMVHESTDGKVGYVHIPDMGVGGFAEFHRGYLTEARRTGLLVDVRKNGGGHVSQLILEKLARTRIGYDITRHGALYPYPSDSILGPMVALTDEHAGSDGDIFSHCFKLMDLGPLIGKRTWGGVVGIWPRHPLVDFSVTTQPEFSFWFEDVGFGVENYGTDPDIEVELDPGAQARGEDPQLERAIEEVLARIEEEKPAVPDFGDIPILRPPESLD